MRKSILVLLSFIVTIQVSAQTLAATVDKRVEIMAIVSRLAEYDEYNQDIAKTYVAGIHAHFDAFKNDTLIKFANNIREELGIGFDAVMSMAVNLKLTNKFTLQNNWKKDLDKRWTQDAAIQFTNLLNNFYTRSKAEVFFLQQAPYYKKITNTFQQVLAGFHLSWYNNYYGIKPKDRFSIVIGCGNAGGNYGPAITISGNVRHAYAIMGSWSFDKESNPVFKEEKYLPTLIHEFNHSFINPVLSQHKENSILKNSVQKILDTMRTEMQKQAYGDWETILNESMVRASVVRYFIDNNPGNSKIAEDEIMDQVNRGFLWTRKLVSLLGIYENNRTKYPTIVSFYPDIITFFQSVADSISWMKTAYENNLPQVTVIEPFGNNAQNVDTSIKEMTISFSHTMTGKGYSINYGKLGEEFYPVKSVIGYTNNNRSVKIELALKPDTEYEMMLTGRAFKSMEGYPIKNYTIKFKTKK